MFDEMLLLITSMVDEDAHDHRVQFVNDCCGRVQKWLRNMWVLLDGHCGLVFCLICSWSRWSALGWALRRMLMRACREHQRGDSRSPRILYEQLVLAQPFICE